jgi:hypothetical protein
MERKFILPLLELQYGLTKISTDLAVGPRIKYTRYATFHCSTKHKYAPKASHHLLSLVFKSISVIVDYRSRRYVTSEYRAIAFPMGLINVEVTVSKKPTQGGINRVMQT